MCTYITGICCLSWFWFWLSLTHRLSERPSAQACAYFLLFSWQNRTLFFFDKIKNSIFNIHETKTEILTEITPYKYAMKETRDKNEKMLEYHEDVKLKNSRSWKYHLHSSCSANAVSSSYFRSSRLKDRIRLDTSAIWKITTSHLSKQTICL